MKDLVHAVRPLVSDFVPTIVFAILVALKVDVRLAVGAALLVGVAQVTIQILLKRKVELLQWASLFLVVVFGALGLMTNDPRFLMLKPSIIYVAIGVVMLRRGWMVRYLPQDAVEHAGPLMIGWGYVWAGLMFTTAAANLAVVGMAPSLWPAFTAVVPLTSKIVLFAVNYLSVRYYGRRRYERAEAEAQALAAAQPAEAQAA
jgi:intracellular septation protein A